MKNCYVLAVAFYYAAVHVEVDKIVYHSAWCCEDGLQSFPSSRSGEVKANAMLLVRGL